MVGFGIGIVLGLALVLYGWYFRRAGHSTKSLWVAVFYLMLPVASWAVVRIEQLRLDHVDPWDVFLSGSLATVVGSFMYGLFVYYYNSRVSDSLLRKSREARLAKLALRGLSAEKSESLRKRVVFTTSPAFFSAYVFLGLSVAGVLLTRKVTEWMLL
jgi:hypothetical protein